MAIANLRRVLAVICFMHEKQNLPEVRIRNDIFSPPFAESVLIIKICLESE